MDREGAASAGGTVPSLAASARESLPPTLSGPAPPKAEPGGGENKSIPAPLTP